jgi:sarcosine oxidase subunit beta
VIRTEIAIVGGGLMGVWTAFFLRRRGSSVVVIETGEVGAQASGVNFGNLRLQGRHPGQYPLALRAAEQWEQLESLVGDRCEFEQTGHLYIATEDAHRAKLAQTAAEAALHGLQVELLEGNELRHRWPFLSHRALAASWSARDAVANPRLVAPAVGRAAAALGAQIMPRTKVATIERRGDDFRLTTEAGDIIEAAQVVNAAGAWGAEIAASFGESVPLFAAGPPQFVTEPIRYFITPAVQAVDGMVIFRQVARGNVVFSGYPRGPSDPVLNRAPVQTEKTLSGMRKLSAVVPALTGTQVIRVWSGIEGYLPDMLPIISRSDTTPGLIHAFGFCGHGFQVSPGVGLVLSEMLLDGGTRTPIGDYAIGRFADPSRIDAAKFAAEFDSSLLGAPRQREKA